MLQSGQVINGTYHVDRRLGCGGMADVFLVTHSRLPRQFALKLLRVEIEERRDFLDRFRREAEILASIRSAHIVDVIDWDYTYDGQPFLAMEYLEGETLAAYLHRCGALSVETALDIFAQIGEGLCAAHAVGVVHRDLKPSNIFLDRNGGRPNFVKILDFGIAKLTQDSRTPLTAHASVMGTPGYMAPEQALGRVEQIDHRADQFSLAVILYEMLSGQPAFYTPGEALYRTLDRVINEDPLPIADSPLARVLHRALAKLPEDRYGSVREFMETVAEAGTLGQYPPQTLAFPASPEAETSHTPARRTLWPLLGLGLILVGGLSGWLLLGPARGALRQISERADNTPAKLLIGSPATSGSPPISGFSPTRGVPQASGSLQPSGSPPTSPKPAVSFPAAVVPAGLPPVLPTPRSADLSVRGVVEEPAASRHSSGAAALSRSFVFSGVNAAQEKVLRVCADKELRTLPGLPSGVIELQRSGALQVVQGPLVVHRSGLTGCLRQAFAATGSEPPRAVTIRVLVSRR